MDDRRTLIARIGALPPGEKLPLARFARELNCSQSVVVALVEGLLASGQIDRSTLRPPPRPETVAGAELAESVRRAARDRRQSIAAFLRPLGLRSPDSWLFQLGQTKKPRAATVAKLTALIAGEPVAPPPERRAHPNQAVRRVDREARGLEPSARELEERRALERQAEARVREEEARAAAERASATRLPGETLAAAVRREAREKGARRALARATGSVVRVLDGAAPREEPCDDPDIGSLSADRRERELRDITTPSALVRRAMADWPDQCGKVARLAIEAGIGKAEAWRRVIAAGIDALEQGA
jgi:hypothetical protein